jgi:hypothetical protein
MIIQGSNNFTPSGRKRKRIASKKKPKAEFKEMKSSPLKNNFLHAEWSKKVAEHKKKPFKVAPWMPDKNQEFKKEISKQYTVSIPYNKGAYQVIPNRRY